MAVTMRSILSLLFLIISSQIATAVGSTTEKNPPQVLVEEEEFHEELLLRPLPDRKVLSHFHFTSTSPPSSSVGIHHHLFPKSISQLVQKFQIKEMELSFTQGRWNYERWGGFDPIPSSNAKPPGVELWAVFDVPQEEVDASWKNLTHALSGLFCASINFLESSTMYWAPKWSFRPASSGSLRHGMLPREAVCTENLTPWLKLLPCRDKAGLSLLMDRPSIYRSFYHSQRLHVKATGTGAEGMNSGIALEQTLTVVLQPNSQRASLTSSREINYQPNWSLTSLFGRRVTGKCVLAKSSNVYIQIVRGLVAELQRRENSGVGDTMTEMLDSVFKLSVNPDRVLEEKNVLQGKGSILYEFSVERYSESQPLDLGLAWNSPVIWSCQQPPLRTSRFLMGSGNERGAIAISLKSTKLNNSSLKADAFSDACELRVDIFQVVPWYVKVYYHSLQLFVDDQPMATDNSIEKIHVLPSKDKMSPGVMEMTLKLPCDVKSAALTVEFDKGFLHIDEYPPDANQGFDVPSAVVTFPNFHTNMRLPLDDSVDKSPMLSKLQEKSPVLSYTEVLLVPLTTPDFSMPYNVITITCTVFALYFGSLLNVLRQRVAEEERILKEKAANKAGPLPQLLSRLAAKLRGRPLESPSPSPPESSSLFSSKLVLKIIMVGVLAIAWQYYFS